MQNQSFSNLLQIFGLELFAGPNYSGHVTSPHQWQLNSCKRAFYGPALAWPRDCKESNVIEWLQMFPMYKPLEWGDGNNQSCSRGSSRICTLMQWMAYWNFVLSTLVYRIDVQDEINVQVGKFLKNIKCAGQNRRAGGNFFSKSINVQTKIRPCRGDFFSQNQ